MAKASDQIRLLGITFYAGVVQIFLCEKLYWPMGHGNWSGVYSGVDGINFRMESKTTMLYAHKYVFQFTDEGSGEFVPLLFHSS